MCLCLCGLIYEELCNSAIQFHFVGRQEKAKLSSSINPITLINIKLERSMGIWKRNSKFSLIIFHSRIKFCGFLIGTDISAFSTL